MKKNTSTDKPLSLFTRVYAGIDPENRDQGIQYEAYDLLDNRSNLPDESKGEQNVSLEKIEDIKIFSITFKNNSHLEILYRWIDIMRNTDDFFGIEELFITLLNYGLSLEHSISKFSKDHHYILKDNDFFEWIIHPMSALNEKDLSDLFCFFVNEGVRLRKEMLIKENLVA